ncbi:secreted protein [Candidatus Magnetoovum chiemensis]|nr:secreted protein [Candidatus Magnetoovum chiemensis]
MSFLSQFLFQRLFSLFLFLFQRLFFSTTALIFSISVFVTARASCKSFLLTTRSYSRSLKIAVISLAAFSLRSAFFRRSDIVSVSTVRCHH